MLAMSRLMTLFACKLFVWWRFSDSSFLCPYLTLSLFVQ
jgi:hypothetical protein